MFEAMKKFSGHLDEKCSGLSDEKLEFLAIARLGFFANLREEIEFLRDLITIADTPEIYKMVENRLDRPGYDFILSKNR